MPTNVENSAVATGLKKVSFHSNPKERQCKCSNYRTIALMSHASKLMLKILQMRLQWYVNQELPDVQAGFRKGRGTRDQISNIHAGGLRFHGAGVIVSQKNYTKKIFTTQIITMV